MEIIQGRYNVRQASSKRHRLKWLWLLLPLLLIFSSGGYTYAAFQKPLPVPKLSANTLEAKPAETVSLAWPGIGQAAIGSLEEGVLATSSQNQAPMPMASITKVVTALAVLKKSPLSPGEQGKTHTFDNVDAGYFSSYLAKLGSVAPVTPGQTATDLQALQALLIISANNYADSLVRWHFGSMDDYLVFANDMLKSFGLEKTVVKDASGFSPQSVSTPSELIILGQKLLKEPVLASIVDTESATLAGGIPVKNTNRIIADADVIGIKTGTTDEAGYCLLFAARHQMDSEHTTTMIGVIMNEPSGNALFRDARSLIASARSGFGAIEVVPAGSRVGTLTTEWNQSVQLVTAEPLTIYGWKGRSYLPTSSLTEAKTASERGLDVGDVGLEASQAGVDVVTNAAVTPPDSLWRLTNYF